MSATQAIRRPGEQRQGAATAPGGFSAQTSTTFPGSVVAGTTGSFGNAPVGAYLLDDRPASQTFGQIIWWSVSAPVLLQNYNGLSAVFTVPTMTLTLQPGCTKHQIFAFFNFGGQNFASSLLAYPTGITGTVLTNTIQYLGGYSAIGGTLAFSGTIAGQFTFWQNGGSVGKLPFTNQTASANQSGSSLVLNTWQNTGLAISGKGGGLQVIASFDGITRQIPGIEINGLIDTVTVDIQANYQNASSPGGFYCGVLSTN